MGCGPSAAEVPSKAPISTNPEEYFDFTGGDVWYTCKPDVALPLKLPKMGMASAEKCPPRTLPQLLKIAAERVPNQVALKVERPCPEVEGSKAPPALPLADWKTWTWKSYYEDSRRAGKGFLKLGLQPYDSVAIWGFNAPEWMLATMGASFAGGKTAGLYPTDAPETAAFKVVHSGAAVVIVEDRVKIQRLLPKLEEKLASIQSLGRVKAFVAYGFVPEPEETVELLGRRLPLITWDAMLDMGKDVKDEELEKRSEIVQPGNCAALVYTSGTTGEPKAGMRSL